MFCPHSRIASKHERKRRKTLLSRQECEKLYLIIADWKVVESSKENSCYRYAFMTWKLALDFGLSVTCLSAAVTLSLLFTTFSPFTLSVCICTQLRASAWRRSSGQIGKQLVCLFLISCCLPLNPHTFSILDRFDYSCPSLCFWESSGCDGNSVAAWGTWPNREVLCVWCLSSKVLWLIHYAVGSGREELRDLLSDDMVVVDWHRCIGE